MQLVKASLEIALSLAVTAFVLVGCSNQYRTADPGMSDQEVLALIEEFNPQLSQSSVVDGSMVTDMLQNFDKYVISFWAGQTDPDTQENATLLSFSEMRPFGFSGMTIFDAQYNSQGPQIQNSTVIFLDITNRETFERRFILYVRMQTANGGPQLVTFTSPNNDFNFSKDEFEIVMQSNADTVPIVMRTFDVSEDFDDELADGVKFRVWILDGGEFDIGQFSTLGGFSTL